MKNDIQKRVDHRLAIAVGHLQKVREMIARDEYCIDVLQQSLSVQAALKKVDELVLKNHLETCVAEAFRQARDRGGQRKRQTTIEEIVGVFEKGRR